MAKEQGKGWAAVGQATKALSQQDQTVRAEADRDREQAQHGLVPLAEVKPRPHDDTREIDAYHVLDLAESVAAVGLLEPLVVDRHHHLLAGAHRWAAVRLLAIQIPDERVIAWRNMAGIEGPEKKKDDALLAIIKRVSELPAIPGPALVPVRIMDFDAEADSRRALSIEITENEKRRDYTKREVTALAERLKVAGFKYTRGKPKKGERALAPALALIIGKSDRTIRRLIGGGGQIRTDVLISETERLVGLFKRMKSTISALQLSAKGAMKHKLKGVLGRAAQLGSSISAFEQQMAAKTKRPKLKRQKSKRG
jgi:ParB family chromosome partitioning protein